VDVFFVVCDGLKGLPDVVINVWPAAIVQTCIVHLIRNTFHLTSKRDWDALKRDVKPVYTAVTAEAARAALDELAEKWGQRYGAVIRLWENAWNKFIPFRTTTSRSARSSARPTRSSPQRPLPAGSQGQRPLPDRAGSPEMPVPGTRSLDPTGTGRTRWAVRWKAALNAFAITFGDRFPAAETY
jgi:putative transposase